MEEKRDPEAGEKRGSFQGGGVGRPEAPLPTVIWTHTLTLTSNDSVESPFLIEGPDRPLAADPAVSLIPHVEVPGRRQAPGDTPPPQPTGLPWATLMHGSFQDFPGAVVETNLGLNPQRPAHPPPAPPPSHVFQLLCLNYRTNRPIHTPPNTPTESLAPARQYRSRGHAEADQRQKKNTKTPHMNRKRG